MRLLEYTTDGRLSLNTYDSECPPPYAILSHTWGADGDEVIFSDFDNGLLKSEAMNKAGYAKIRFCGEQALKDDLRHFWVDTCCIDKSSSAELSESLNSMFRWYERADKCYVYLQDVSALKRDSGGEIDWKPAFRRSRWFTRGWTLQELLAPKSVDFWSRDGKYLGSKIMLRKTIEEVTGVPVSALEGASLPGFTVQERLRWAVKRETKRREDKAYCLLGVFGIVIPIIYGEGANAFARLREAIALHQRGHTLGSYDDPASLLMNGDLSREGRRQELLASLTFDQIDARYSSIKPAERTTCSWILEHAMYRVWIDRDIRPQRLGILWISGRAGAGKSTLMKFIFSHAVKNKLEDEVILSFFFNARGEELEKTTLGMYRSILLQLLNEVPDLQILLDDSVVSRISPDQPSPWTLEALQVLLSNAVKRLGQRRLCLFIDALDECDEEQVRDMIKFFDELENDVSADGRVDICFASRPYPLIDVECGQRLELEDQSGHVEDLKKFINRRLEIGKGKLVNEVQQQLQEKANGVFMWVVLVVDTLNHEFRRGRIFAVKQRLQEIPSGLSDLFKDLLRRDRVNMDDLLLCLQWVLFAKRPLRREEFYFAMVAGWNCRAEHGPRWVPEPWDREEATLELMDRFVLSSSKGLAEVTRSKKNPTVQFIHESVRDFLLKDGGLHDLWPELDENVIGVSHEKLKSCCLTYLNADLSQFWSADRALPKAYSAEARDLRQKIPQAFSLHKYAIEEVIHHANEAGHVKRQEAFVRDFPTVEWIRAINVHQRFGTRRYDPDEKPLYVFASENAVRLIQMSNFTWQEAVEGNARSPFLAAFENGSLRALEALLRDRKPAFFDKITKDPGFGKRAEIRSKLNLMSWAFANGNLSFALCLSTSPLEQAISTVRTVTESVGGSSEEGSLPNDKALLPFKTACSDSRNTAFEALRTDNWRVVDWLLDAYADTFTTVQKRAALSVASSKGHLEIVKALVRAGASVGEVPWPETTALHSAALNGHTDVVHFLLNAGAEVNKQERPDHGRTALEVATERDDAATVEVLLQHPKIDVNLSTSFAESVLQLASKRGCTKIVKMLLHAGADVNARRRYGDDPLKAASGEGHAETVEILLRAGAYVNTPGGRYVSALQAASWGGYAPVVEILLNAGAEVNANEGEALLAASRQGHAKVVEMLLHAGADIHARGGEHGSALQAVVKRLQEPAPEIWLLREWEENRKRWEKFAGILVDAGARIEEDLPI